MNLAIAKAKPSGGSKMTLGAIISGRQERPLRVVLYGTEGVGKSTWAADAPGAIFICAEDGTSRLPVSRFPTPECLDDVFEALRALLDEHDFKTLVFDTLDWLEPLIWAHICKRDGKRSIEDYGYGKGYTAALDEWRRLLSAIEHVQRAKGMNVVLLAHSWIKKFQNPTADDYDRYELKLNTKASGLVKEWAEDVLFACHEEFVATDKNRARGVSTGARVVHTSRDAAWDAKNRNGLPDVLPLSWADYAAAVEAGQPVETNALLAEIERKAALLDGADKSKALEAIKRADGDAVKLAKLNNWINARAALSQPEGGTK